MAFSFWLTDLPLVTDPSIKLSQSSVEAKGLPERRGGGNGRDTECQRQETLRIVLSQKEYLADAIAMKFRSLFGQSAAFLGEGGAGSRGSSTTLV